jgi:hypothetical protein
MREVCFFGVINGFSVTGKASKSERLRALPDKYFWKANKFFRLSARAAGGRSV